MHFSGSERKELSNTNAVSGENIPQKWEGNKHILRWRKTKRICGLQNCTSRMTNRRFLNRKKQMIESN